MCQRLGGLSLVLSSAELVAGDAYDVRVDGVELGCVTASGQG